MRLPGVARPGGALGAQGPTPRAVLEPVEDHAPGRGPEAAVEPLLINDDSLFLLVRDNSGVVAAARRQPREDEIRGHLQGRGAYDDVQLVRHGQLQRAHRPREPAARLVDADASRLLFLLLGGR